MAEHIADFHIKVVRMPKKKTGSQGTLTATQPRLLPDLDRTSTGPQARLLQWGGRAQFSDFLDSTGGSLGVLPGPRGPPQSSRVEKVGEIKYLFSSEKPCSREVVEEPGEWRGQTVGTSKVRVRGLRKSKILGLPELSTELLLRRQIGTTY